MKRYIAKEAKPFWILLIILTIINLIFIEQRFPYLPYVVLVLLLLALFLQYELRIDEKNKQLVLQIKLFAFAFITRTLTPDRIQTAYFLKLRKKKIVLLKVKGGLRWKLTNFQPYDYDDAIIEFLTKEQVKIEKLNGY